MTWFAVYNVALNAAEQRIGAGIAFAGAVLIGAATARSATPDIPASFSACWPH